MSEVRQHEKPGHGYPGVPGRDTSAQGVHGVRDTVGDAGDSAERVEGAEKGGGYAGKGLTKCPF